MGSVSVEKSFIALVTTAIPRCPQPSVVGVAQRHLASKSRRREVTVADDQISLRELQRAMRWKSLSAVKSGQSFSTEAIAIWQSAVQALIPLAAHLRCSLAAAIKPDR